MRSLFLLVFLGFITGSRAQSFYEKIMEMNMAIADTSKDIMELERGAYAMDRVSKGVKNNWPAYYHVSLCFVRITDLLILKKDTAMAKKKLEMAAQYIRRTVLEDSIDPENWILASYQRINGLRLKSTDPKEIKLFEAQLDNFKKLNTANPRACLVQAYFYKCFFSANKSKRKRALELVMEAEKLFEQEKVVEYRPEWGRKWMNELKGELNKPQKTN